MPSAAHPAFRPNRKGSNSLAAMARSLALAAVMLVVVAAGVAGLYLVKSALGINIFPGHSPLLHATLYPLVRG